MGTGANLQILENYATIQEDITLRIVFVSVKLKVKRDDLNGLNCNISK